MPVHGIEYGLLLARTLYPDTVANFSSSAHWSVAKIAAKLRIPAVTVRSLPDGQMDLHDLLMALRDRRQHAAAAGGLTTRNSAGPTPPGRASTIEPGRRVGTPNAQQRH